MAKQWYRLEVEEENFPIEVRPLNVKIPEELKPDPLATQSSGSNETAADPMEPELRCNAKVMLFDGDAFTIKSPGYPNPSQENEKYDKRLNSEVLLKRVTWAFLPACLGAPGTSSLNKESESTYSANKSNFRVTRKNTCTSGSASARRSRTGFAREQTQTRSTKTSNLA